MDIGDRNDRSSSWGGPPAASRLPRRPREPTSCQNPPRPSRSCPSSSRPVRPPGLAVRARVRRVPRTPTDSAPLGRRPLTVTWKPDTTRKLPSLAALESAGRLPDGRLSAHSALFSWGEASTMLLEPGGAMPHSRRRLRARPSQPACCGCCRGPLKCTCRSELRRSQRSGRPAASGDGLRVPVGRLVCGGDLFPSDLSRCPGSRPDKPALLPYQPGCRGGRVPAVANPRLLIRRGVPTDRTSRTRIKPSIAFP
jgi:hypothetical protein